MQGRPQRGSVVERPALEGCPNHWAKPLRAGLSRRDDVPLVGSRNAPGGKTGPVGETRHAAGIEARSGPAEKRLWAGSAERSGLSAGSPIRTGRYRIGLAVRFEPWAESAEPIGHAVATSVPRSEVRCERAGGRCAAVTSEPSGPWAETHAVEIAVRCAPWAGRRAAANAVRFEPWAGIVERPWLVAPKPWAATPEALFERSAVTVSPDSVAPSGHSAATGPPSCALGWTVRSDRSSDRWAQPTIRHAMGRHRSRGPAASYARGPTTAD